MKTAIATFFLSLLFDLTPAFGQDTLPGKTKRIQNCDISIQAGNCVEQKPVLGLSDFKTLAPGSTILSWDHEGYLPDHFVFQINKMYSVMAGIRLPGRKKDSQKLIKKVCFGITRYSGNNMSGYYFKESLFRADTVYIRGGRAVYLDSSYTEGIYFTYRSEQIRLDISFLFETNSASQIKFSSGLGANGGVSSHESMSIAYTKISYIIASEYYYPSFFGLYMDGENFVELIPAQRHAGFSVYMPLRLDLRLGKKKEEGRNLYVFYESRLMINTNFYPGLEPITRFQHHHGVGIKL